MLTVPEVSSITGKPQSTIYRNIKKGRLRCTRIIDEGGKEVTKISVKDLENYLGRPIDFDGFARMRPDKENNSCPGDTYDSNVINNQYTQSESHLTKEHIREVIEEFFETRQTQLMKPLEEHALYQVGRLEKEVEHLKAEKEVLIGENEFLREQLKALPGPVEEVSSNLK